jgi:hypothetical protein
MKVRFRSMRRVTTCTSSSLRPVPREYKFNLPVAIFDVFERGGVGWERHETHGSGKKKPLLLGYIRARRERGD